MRTDIRQAFAHNAVIVMGSAKDLGAPGAAITVALCGQWDHEPPCPLAPHHSSAVRDGDNVRLRILFAVELAKEPLVRRRIDEALGGGELCGPDGATTNWQLLSSEAAEVSAEEAAHAERLTQS
jgi:hypothetical protein